jgi:hypothetical protein
MIDTDEPIRRERVDEQTLARQRVARKGAWCGTEYARTL